MLFSVDQVYRTIPSRVCRTAPSVVVRDTLGDVIGLTHIERAIAAAKHVDEPHTDDDAIVCRELEWQIIASLVAPR